ncbi:hypothetical protein ACFO4O_08580 [Glaciecola siphonariae]|uniref:DUF3718 domain-containing protein n=1 Tax=Glaciecola siphonariae TaxID=521012 RepID=A0ABV9LX03_9ALTE
MKALTTLLALSFLAPSTVFAAPTAASNVVLKPVNNNLETQVCYVAATKGLNAAKLFVAKQDMTFSSFSRSVTCNGVSIEDFANKYAVKSNANEEAIKQQLSTYKLVALDNKESQLCVDAVVLGEQRARAKHGIDDEVVFCNSKTLGSFARSFRNKNVTL